MAPHQRKISSKKIDENVKKETTENISKTTKDEHEPFKMPWKRIIIRILLSILIIFAIYWTNKKDDPVFASQKQKIQLQTAEVPCSIGYKTDISKFKGCIPKQCGRLVSDVVVSPAEAAHLLRLSRKGLAFGGSNGGASILDLHSGALSDGNSFINVYEKINLLRKENAAVAQSDVFNEEDFKVYKNVRNKIQQIISFNFGVPVNKLYLTHPTFFSEMTSKSAKTKHDEYWHVHIDKDTYPSFHYTSLLYLSDYGIDFTGGRFIFVDEGKNITIEPRSGRVSAFTSGAENPHYVERVSSGIRYALTVSFTCDPKFAIQDPSVKKFSVNAS